MEETAGEAPCAMEEGKQEEYRNLEKRCAIADWINRAPQSDAETTKEIDKALKEIAEYEEKLKRRDLEGWRAKGWEEREEWKR